MKKDEQGVTSRRHVTTSRHHVTSRCHESTSWRHGSKGFLWASYELPIGFLWPLLASYCPISADIYQKHCDRERDFRTRSYLGPGVEGYPDKFPIFVRRRLQGSPGGAKMGAKGLTLQRKWTREGLRWLRIGPKSNVI